MHLNPDWMQQCRRGCSNSRVFQRSCFYCLWLRNSHTHTHTRWFWTRTTTDIHTSTQAYWCTSPALGGQRWFSRTSRPLSLPWTTMCRWPGSQRTCLLSGRSGWEEQRWTVPTRRPAETSPGSCRGYFCGDKQPPSSRICTPNIAFCVKDIVAVQLILR